MIPVSHYQDPMNQKHYLHEEILLDRCRSATDLTEQKQCFADISVFLEKIQTNQHHTDRIDRNKDTNNPPSCISLSSHPSSRIPSTEILAAREKIARSVLTIWPYWQVPNEIDRILDACGHIVAITTCSILLKDITSKKSFPEKSLSLQSIIQGCWATIQRMLLSERPNFDTGWKNERDIKECLNENICDPTIDHLDNSDIRGCSDHGILLEWERFVTGIVLFLPQTLANACHALKLKVPLHSTPNYLYQRLVHSAWIRTRTSAKVDNTHWYIKSMITKLLQTRRSEYVVQGLMRSDNYINRFGSKTASLSHSNEKVMSLKSFLISLHLLPHDMANLILSLLQFVSVHGQSVESNKCTIFDCFRDRILVTCNSLFGSSSLEHQEVIIEKLIFSRCSSFWKIRGDDSQIKKTNRYCWIRWMIEVIAPSDTQTPSTLSTNCSYHTSSYLKHLTNIADRWSQWTFVQEVNGNQQHHVSLVLRRGLVRLMTISSSSSSSSTLFLQNSTQRELTMFLVNGVSHRLSSTIATIRHDGMRIAQLLANGLGQDIQFDEFLSDDDDGEGVCDSNDHKKDTTTLNNDYIKLKEKKQQLVDPDADYDSDEESDGESQIYREQTVDDEENDDLSVEFEDELIPYELDDDEDDLRETPRPLHLLEALELLRTGDNHDHAYSRHEIALDTLPSLICARPDNLKDVAISLVLQLLRMEDKFNIHHFKIKRETAIQALIIDSPVLVGQVVITQLFEEGGLADRLSILSCLQIAAHELSGNPTASRFTPIWDQDDSVASTRLSIDHGRRDSESDSKLVSKVLSQTRRKRSWQQKQSFKNRFSEIAPLWFYTLVDGFIKHKEDDNLWMGSTGSIFLSFFFRCLASIVDFAGIQGSQVVANDLLDLVWDFRAVDIAEVRLSVLVAVSTAIAKLSDEKLISLLYGETDLPRTILEMSKKDPDEECRTICNIISNTIHEVQCSNSIFIKL